jgi:methionyl-tRNA formyltransferase
MDAGLDTGDMLAMGRVAILADDTTASLHDRLALQGGQMVVAALQKAAAVGRAPATPQPADGICYAHKIEKAESAIDWALPATVIERRVRAFDPFPGASFQCEGEAVKLWQARVAPLAQPARPGTVLCADATGLLVACGEGALQLLQLQRPGGKRLVAAAFVQARPGLAGQVLPATA